jgi:hypothetical protein
MGGLSERSAGHLAAPVPSRVLIDRGGPNLRKPQAMAAAVDQVREMDKRSIPAQRRFAAECAS